MQIGVVTLFQEMFEALHYGITGRAIQQSLLSIDYFNPRTFTHDPHKTVDDRPYGGGPGMVLMAEPLGHAIHQAKETLGQTSRVIYLTPQGIPLEQTVIQRWAETTSPLIFVAGRYEEIDARAIEHHIDEEYSMGDYVLSGGELPIMCIIDAIARLLPGSLHDGDSAKQDSFSNGLLDCPHYTRPVQYLGSVVPEILLSGHHDEIRKWRLKQSLGRTYLRRPDLLEKRSFTLEEKGLLQAFIEEQQTIYESNVNEE